MASDFRALCQTQGVFHIYAEVSDRAFNLRMSQKYLDRAEIAGGLVADGRLGAPQGMGAVILARQANPRDPFVDQAGILARADMGCVICATGEDKIFERSNSQLKSFQKVGASIIHQLELDGPSGLLLNDGGPRLNFPIAEDVADPHFYQVAAA